MKSSDSPARAKMMRARCGLSYWWTSVRKLRVLNERSLREPLQYTDPKALFELVCYAKHLGMWRGYRQNQVRLRYVDPDEPITELSEDEPARANDGQMILFGEPDEET